jgi:hypothetical protein
MNAHTMYPQKYYVYYDKKSGTILSVSNEKSSQYEYGIELPFEDVEKLLSGEWKFSDYIVGYAKNNYIIMSSTTPGYAFKYNLFEWIVEQDKETECIVEWNGARQSWIFSLSANYKSTRNDVIFIPDLVFFVTMASDFDFLIRTIKVSMTPLLANQHVEIPFESTIENRIDKISISSKLVFKSYRLKITND